MQKLPMHTKNIADENFKKLAELFPQAVTEVVGKDENGKTIIERAIDKDVLTAEIAAKVVDGNEQRYQFTWPDKAKTVHASNQPIYKTLRPCREESVNFDDTENLYIEGDNLEVLKLLQESYLGKVKMIYIDPPYNTGNDFVYNDRFTMDDDDWDEVSGDYDEEGNRLFKNTDSNGRFHTDWLNMLYPRLKIARDLLSDDGVIFISIDDNEVHNLRKICDEVFGTGNFLSQTIIQSNKRGQTYKDIAKCHEYLLIYYKSEASSVGELEKTEVKLPYSDEYGMYDLWELRNRNPKFGRHNRPNLYYPIYVDTKSKNSEGLFSISLEKTEQFDFEVLPKNSVGDESCWRWGKEKTLKEGILAIPKALFAKPKRDGGWNIYEKSRKSTTKAKSIWIDTAVITEQGTIESGKLGMSGILEYPKPIELIKRAVQLSDDSNATILDFFSGSATTAHAVMQLNAEDGGKRKFIMVQLPEATDEKSEAFKAGYANICEIGKERIRRAGVKIKDKAEEENKSIPDIGFRVLKVDSSHFVDNVARTPSETTYKTIMESVDNIKHDRSPEDLLFYAMHQLGIPLSSKITPVVIQDKKVFEVYYADMLYLTASFDKNLTESIITEIAQKKPLYFAMRDSSQATDSVATNFDEIFKLYSPSTERWVL